MLVGVPSYRSAVALQRRAAIRELGFVGSERAAPNVRAWLRFVMADDQADVDQDKGDIWLFPLPAQRRAKKSYGLEKYLLSNAFLRAAVARPETPPLLVSCYLIRGLSDYPRLSVCPFFRNAPGR